MTKTPVLFLVFNRPEKTQKVFDVIRQAKPQKLYIAADGARPHIVSDMDNCSKVKEIVKNIDWECNAKFLFHEKNLGCSLAGKTAWDWLFTQEEEMIFIEDDGLLSISFFSFAEELLERYRNNSRIAYISSENFGLKYGVPSTYFFSRFGGGTYAMATWKRVYELYEYKLESYIQTKDKNEFKNTFINKFDYDYTNSKFENYLKNGGNTYDLQMVYLIHKYNMLNVIPNINMCSNIGFDFEGTNTNIDPNSTLALKFNNRERFELSEIIHPVKAETNNKFERKYFKVRVLYGKSIILFMFRFYLRPYLGSFYRKFLKKLLMFLRLKKYE